MPLHDKQILLISPEPWDHIFVSKHHYAVHLAWRGNNVFFLNPPGNETRIGKTQFENILTVDYSGFPKGLRFYPRFLQKKIIRRVFQQLQEACSARFDVVWSFDNSVFFDLSCLPSSVLKISHIVDLNQDFQTPRAARTADYCFCTTEIIKRKLLAYNPNTYKINHGFNTHSAPMVQESPFAGTRLKAVYAGNLSIPCIDWVLVSTVVTSNPDVDFYFIGPNAHKLCSDVIMNKAKKRVLEAKNVSFVGKVDSGNLQQYYQFADVLLVVYQEKNQDNQANPHKIMEYLGSGKVIVATYTSEYEKLDPMVVMADRNSGWPDLFSNVLNDLPFYNSARLQNLRKAFAMDNSYDRQISRIENVLFKIESDPGPNPSYNSSDLRDEEKNTKGLV